MIFSGVGVAQAGGPPVDAAMAIAREKTVDFFAADVPPGCEEAVLAQAVRVQREMDRAQYAVLARLAQLEATGALLEAGGQRTVQAWIRHHFGLAAGQAKDLARLGRALHQEQLPQVDQAFEIGLLSLGEAAAVAKCVDKAVEERDEKVHPDEGEFRAKMETGLIAYKQERPQVSVSQISAAAKAIASHLDPDKADRDYDEAFEERGAQLSTTFEGGFLLRMWGPAADGELLKAALNAYTQPHTPEMVHQPKHERTYDAVLLAMQAAAGHRVCAQAPQPLVTLNVTVPVNALLGDPQAKVPTTESGAVIPPQMVARFGPHSWMRRLLTDSTGQTVLDVGRKHRCAPDPIRTAARFCHTTCAWEDGCDVPIEWTQSDHIVPFSEGGTTKASNIQPLCSTHNRLKHRRHVARARRTWAHHRTGHTKKTGAKAGAGSDGKPAPPHAA